AAGADRHGRAVAVAVAGAVVATAAVGHAPAVRLHAAGRNRLARAGVSGEVAHLAVAAAAARAADAVDAVAAVALGAGRADLTETLEAAGAGVAELARRAVGVARADGHAGV